MFLISASVDRERASEAFAAMLRALDELRGGELKAEFVRARRKVLREVLADALTSESVADELEFVVTYNLPRTYHAQLARSVAQLRLDDVRAVLDRELSDRRQVVMVRGKRAWVEAMYRQSGIEQFRVVE